MCDSVKENYVQLGVGRLDVSCVHNLPLSEMVLGSSTCFKFILISSEVLMHALWLKLELELDHELPAASHYDQPSYRNSVDSVKSRSSCSLILSWCL